MTGAEFSQILDLRIDKAYSGFLTNTEKNRLIKEATVKSIKSYYRTLSDQDKRDGIIAFIKTNQVFTPVGNEIFITPSGSPAISDYDDIFAVKAKFAQRIYGVSVTGATNASPIVLTISGTNNLRSGELITISDVVGNFAANGTHYIKKINDTKIGLYADVNLQTPVAGNGAYSSGGTLSRVFYNYCLPLVSDKKIDPYAKATVRNPRFEVANSKIKITPSDSACSEITMDYLATPSTSQLIDVANNIIDLEETYPIDFIYLIVSETANLFAQSFRDNELFQTSNFEIQKGN